MKLNCDLQSVKATEFGIGRDEDAGQSFVAIPVDGEVQQALNEITLATWEAMQAQTKDPPRYEASEKHGSIEYLHLPLGSDLVTSIRELHSATNLPIDSNALADPSAVFCYFARMIDDVGNRLTALRRATQFKGVLKSRLVRLVTDALKLIEDQVFKLDNDFDLLVDSENIHILRPSGFEFAGKLQEAILEAVPKSVAVIQKDLDFVDFAPVQEYALTHPRAARYIASIRSQKETTNIDKSALKWLCKATGVELKESKGMLAVGDGHILGFLEVLDRRRYKLELVKGSPERFRAASREKLGG
jgi:hypothetical protein